MIIRQELRRVRAHCFNPDLSVRELIQYEGGVDYDVRAYLRDGFIVMATMYDKDKRGRSGPLVTFWVAQEEIDYE